jgi:hypothetical protein
VICVTDGVATDDGGIDMVGAMVEDVMALSAARVLGPMAPYPVVAGDPLETIPRAD